MIKRLAQSIREYKLPSVLTVIFIMGEAIIECFIPFLTANLVNSLKVGAEMSMVLRSGAGLVVAVLLLLQVPRHLPVLLKIFAVTYSIKSKISPSII